MCQKRQGYQRTNLSQVTHGRQTLPKMGMFCINPNESSVFCIMEMFHSRKLLFESFGFKPNDWQTRPPKYFTIQCVQIVYSHTHSSHKCIVNSQYSKLRLDLLHVQYWCSIEVKQKSLSHEISCRRHMIQDLRKTTKVPIRDNVCPLVILNR